MIFVKWRSAAVPSEETISPTAILTANDSIRSGGGTGIRSLATVQALSESNSPTRGLKLLQGKRDPEQNVS
jgi:hypothetical protein